MKVVSEIEVLKAPIEMPVIGEGYATIGRAGDYFVTFKDESVTLIEKADLDRTRKLLHIPNLPNVN